jgi:iron complex transport system permease protein
MLTGPERIEALTGDKKRGVQSFMALSHKRKMQVLAIAIVVVFLLSMIVKTTVPGVNSPLAAFRNFFTWIELNMAHLFGWPVWLDRFNVIEALGGSYYDTVSRFLISVITFVCGMLLALSGNIFQSVFRNPIAAPAMLGVGTGVSIGLIVLVLTYGTAALTMPVEKYEYCYLFALIMLGSVLLIAKLSGGRRKFSVFDLLIVASIFSTVVGGIIGFFSYGMDNDLALVLADLSNAIVVNTEPVSFAALGIVSLISLVPFFLLRFSFNAVCFDNEESSSMGVNTRIIKFISLILGSLMVVAAMVHSGSVGMISLMVPFVSRSIFGAESRNLFWGNILIGGLVLLICRDIAAFIPYGNHGFPIGGIVQFLSMPVFILILISGRRTWE